MQQSLKSRCFKFFIVTSIFDVEGVRRRRRKKRRVCNRWPFQEAGQIAHSIPKSLSCLNTTGCCSKWNDTGTGCAMHLMQFRVTQGRGSSFFLKSARPGPHQTLSTR